MFKLKKVLVENILKKVKTINLLYFKNTFQRKFMNMVRLTMNNENNE